MPRGNIDIKLTTEKSVINIIVEDTGIGIPYPDIPKIFDRFYRVEKSRSRALGGSGLGLAICKWIIDLHNAEISVNSDVNKGTIFKISFPK